MRVPSMVAIDWQMSFNLLISFGGVNVSKSSDFT